MQRYLKISGVKPKSDINSIIYEINNNHFKDIPLLFNISNANANPHAILNATINLYGSISQNLREFGCLYTFYMYTNSFKIRFTPFGKTYSRYCCELISQLKTIKKNEIYN